MNDVMEHLRESFKSELRMVAYCLENGEEPMLTWCYLPKLVKLAEMINAVKMLPKVDNENKFISL